MSKKESIVDEISDVKKELESYGQNRIDLAKLHAAENLSRLSSTMAFRLVLFYIGFFVLFFASMAGAYAIGTILGSTELGFLVVSGVYFIIGIIFFLFKGILIQRPIIKSFVNLFFPNFNEYE